MGIEYFQCTICRENFKSSATSPKRLELTKKKGGVEVLQLCNACHRKKISDLRNAGHITKVRAQRMMKG